MPRVPFSLRVRRNESGASAIEFAAVFPLFALMIVGLFVYGIYFGVVHSVQQLAGEAARATVAGMSPAERQTLARQHIARAAPGYPLIDPGLLGVTARVSASDPNLFEVELTYDASALPIFAFQGLLPVPQKQVRRRAVVRRGGY